MNLIMWGYHLFYLIGAPVVLLSILAFSRNDPIWGALIKLFNIFFASIIAINYFEPLANILDGAMSVMLYYNDVLAFFIIFCVTLAILGEVSRKLSKINVYFPAKTNLIGTYCILFVLFVGFYSTAGFIFMSLLPEAPHVENISAPPTMKLLNYASSGSMKSPDFLPHGQFNSETFLQGQNARNCAIYSALENTDSWQFDGESPNVK